MILERAIYHRQTRPGRGFQSAFAKARPHIAPPRAAARRRCIAASKIPTDFILLVWWDTLEDHMVGFREFRRLHRMARHAGPAIRRPARAVRAFTKARCSDSYQYPIIRPPVMAVSQKTSDSTAPTASRLRSRRHQFAHPVRAPGFRAVHQPDIEQRQARWRGISTSRNGLPIYSLALTDSMGMPRAHRQRKADAGHEGGRPRQRRQRHLPPRAQQPADPAAGSSRTAGRCPGYGPD